MDTNLSKSPYQSVFSKACLAAQCMVFKRNMIPSVFDLFKKYDKKYGNKYIEDISLLMQILLLTCNDTEYGENHRRECKAYAMKISLEHKRKYL